MRQTRTVRSLPKSQRGALLVLTLVILLVISILGTATMDTTGLEMRMVNNTRDQQLAFEAAEYTLSWVQNDIALSNFTDAQITNSSCGSVCFNSSCSGGYCFDGDSTTAGSYLTCTLGSPANEKYTIANIWTNTARHRTLSVPNIGVTTRYIIEFRCFTALDSSADMDSTNVTRVFRITSYAEGPAGRGRAMLRAVIKEG